MKTFSQTVLVRMKTKRILLCYEKIRNHKENVSRVLPPPPQPFAGFFIHVMIHVLENERNQDKAWKRVRSSSVEYTKKKLKNHLRKKKIKKSHGQESPRRTWRGMYNYTRNSSRNITLYLTYRHQQNVHRNKIINWNMWYALLLLLTARGGGSRLPAGGEIEKQSGL